MGRVGMACVRALEPSTFNIQHYASGVIRLDGSNFQFGSTSNIQRKVCAFGGVGKECASDDERSLWQASFIPKDTAEGAYKNLDVEPSRQRHTRSELKRGVMLDVGCRMLTVLG